jgi:hypothetical protein
LEAKPQRVTIMGDRHPYQHTEQREDGHNADRSLDTALQDAERELDCTLTHALLACSVAQEARITAAERITEARALREKATALRREAQRYHTAKAFPSSSTMRQE